MRNLLFFGFPWAAPQQLPLVCALLSGADQSVGALLEAPHAAQWVVASLIVTGGTPVQTAVMPAPPNRTWFSLEVELPSGAVAPAPLANLSFTTRRSSGRAVQPPMPGLVPLSRCPRRCGLLGACVGSPARCECFSPARPLRGSCEPHPASRMPQGEGPSTAAVIGRGPRHGILCPGACSGVGACDLEGFCRCPEGRWGLDCALGFDGNGKPAVLAPRASDAYPRRMMRTAASTGRLTAGAAWPRVYVHDLPPILRIQRQSFDVEVREPLLLPGGSRESGGHGRLP